MGEESGIEMGRDLLVADRESRRYAEQPAQLLADRA